MDEAPEDALTIGRHSMVRLIERLLVDAGALAALVELARRRG
jgi:hypothetical protein